MKLPAPLVKTWADVQRNFDALAGRVAVTQEAPLNVEWPKYGAGPYKTPAQNSAAFALALAAVPAAGGDILFPRSMSYDTTLSPADGMRWLGDGAQQRWRSAASGTKLTYTGTGKAVHIANVGATHREAVEIHNIRFDGTGLTGSVDGLFVDGTSGTDTDYVEGVLLSEAAFTNFPRHQVLMDGLIIDATFRRCAFNNVITQGAFDLVRTQQTAGGANVVTQVTFDDCFSAQHAAAWAYRGNAIDVRFNNGTIQTITANAGGIWADLAALTLLGTHLEGYGHAAGSIGIRRTGVNPAIIMPSQCVAFADGIQVGDSSSPTVPAVDTVINGMVGNNTVDVRLVAGGSRRGTKLISAGEALGTPAVVADDRRTTDGVWELMWLHSTGAQVLPRVAPASAPNNSAYVSSVDGKFYFKDNSGTSNALY